MVMVKIVTKPKDLSELVDWTINALRGYQAWLINYDLYQWGPKNSQKVKQATGYLILPYYLKPVKGVQAFRFWKQDFDLWVGGDGLDMYQQLEDVFGSMRTILPIWGLGAKMGQKPKT